MGRKLRGAKLRAEKRSKVAAEEIVETQARETERLHISQKPNEDLFVLDTTAIQPSKKQERKKIAKKEKQQRIPSALEQRKVDALLEKHSPEDLQTLAAPLTTAKHAFIKGKLKAFDLWGDDAKDHDKKKKKSSLPASAQPGIGSTLAGIVPAEHMSIVQSKALPAPNGSRLSVDVAMPGQSYNPDKVLHQKVLKDAVTVERQRHKAQKEKAAPVSKGLSAETKALMVGDSDSEDESSIEDHNDSISNDNLKSLQKMPTKLTRAQRNKQKRLKAEEWQRQETKRQKKFHNSLSEAGYMNKLLKRQERDHIHRRERIHQLKEQDNRTRGTNVYLQLSKENPIQAPSLPVALSNELGGLRTLQPKGSLLTDRLASWRDRDMATKPVLVRKKRVQGKRRKSKVRGKGWSRQDGGVLG